MSKVNDCWTECSCDPPCSANDDSGDDDDDDGNRDDEEMVADVYSTGASPAASPVHLHLLNQAVHTKRNMHKHTNPQSEEIVGGVLFRRA